LTVKQSAALAACVLRATTKNVFEEKVHDLLHDLSDLEMTFLPSCPGAAIALEVL